MTNRDETSIGAPDGAIYFEDYEVGRTRTTLGRTITETDIVLHAGQIGDLYPHHLDEEWSRTGPFGTRIAHGTLVFAIASGLIAHEINPVSFSYGYDRLRFIRPVFIGDTVRVLVEVTETRPNPKRPASGFVHEQGTVVNQHGETVLAFTHIALVDRRLNSESRE
jgi:acyl dehydratase